MKQTNDYEKLQLHIPRLKIEPAIGSSCCAVLAEVLIKDEFHGTKGIIDLQIDTENATAEINFNPTEISYHQILETLSFLGYPAQFANKLNEGELSL